MKQFTIITLLLLGATLQGQSILPHLDSIVQSRDTNALIEFCEQWHQETKNHQPQTKTSNSIHQLLETILANDTSNRYSVIHPYFTNQKKVAYYVPQDFVYYQIHNKDWDIPNEKVRIETEITKNNQQKTVTKTFKLKELRGQQYNDGLTYFLKNEFKNNKRQTLTEFTPTFKGRLSNLKPCYLIGKYKDFSNYIASLNNFHVISYNSDYELNGVIEEPIHSERADFISCVLGAQSGYLPGDMANGIHLIQFNKTLDKAIVDRNIVCGHLVQAIVFYEKINGKWVDKGRYYEK